MDEARDDLGHPFQPGGPARRVVSLVPSLTESVAVTRPEALAGATDWCTHPAGLDVPRVRGTKNPDLAAIRALRPDLVLANQEENRRLDVERLRAAGVPVWVTVIQTVDQALASLRRMFVAALRWPVPDWLAAAERVWREPAPATRVRAVIPVWRDPWMVVGSATFTNMGCPPGWNLNTTYTAGTPATGCTARRTARSCGRWGSTTRRSGAR